MNTRWLLAVCFVLAGAGFLLPLWPLSVVGILIAGLSGHSIFALCVGLLLDIAYGAPMGTLHILILPFTIVSLLSILARHFGLRYFLDKSFSDTL